MKQIENDVDFRTEYFSQKEIEIIDAKVNVVSAILKRRKEMGITQRQLAALTGLTQASIARLETFDTNPRLETILKITNALGLEVLPEKNEFIVYHRNVSENDNLFSASFSDLEHQNSDTWIKELLNA